METIRGRILSMYADHGVPFAVVEIDAAPTCPRCESGRGCGAGIFGASQRSRRIDARVREGLDLQAGDTVDVGIGPGELLGAAATVYGIPMIGGALGAALAWSAGGGDAVAALVAVIGVTAGVFAARRRLRAARCVASLRPTILGRSNRAA